MLEFDEVDKICPIMSSDSKKINCNKKCAWYADDISPAKCAIMDISFTLCHIEKQLEDISLQLPSQED